MGAWIETIDVNDWFMQEYVAPHVGAWIETKVKFSTGKSLSGRPSRGGVD